MKPFAGVLALTLLLVPACRHRETTQKADLNEAGYKFTADDWFRACRDNDGAALAKFLKGGFAVDTRDANGDTGLHVAAASGAEDAADFLLDHKLAIDVRGANDRTPLMSAALADQATMVRWLLRQGADPLLKDKEEYRALMLASREGHAGPIAELAAHDRDDLDGALLLAAMMDRAKAIDALTSFGASVYARMDDERTPLMVAAENGNRSAVEMLLEVGANRLDIDSDGQTAAELATAAGHTELAELIARDPRTADLALETPEKVGSEMEAFVDGNLAKADLPAPVNAPNEGAVTAEPTRGSATPGNAAHPDKTLSPAHREPVVALQDQTITLSKPVPAPTRETASAVTPVVANTAPAPELVMRHYQQKIMPVRVRSVQGETATLVLTGATNREVKVKAGDTIPGSNLVVVHVRRRMEDSKVNLGKPTEISVVAVKDRSTGMSREWIAGIPSQAHEPVALVEDAGTGRRYVAAAGQTFRGEDGETYSVIDVRPNQMIIRDSAGISRTIVLRGPRG